MAPMNFHGRKQFSFLCLILFSFFYFFAGVSGAVATDIKIASPTESAVAAETSPYFTPMRSDAGLTKADVLIKKGKLAEAMQTVDNILKRNARNADALTYKGYVYFLLGDPKQAKNYFHKVIKREPLHLGANLHLGQLYAETGKIARAIEQLQVIRMYCGKTHCGEIDYLQTAINNGRLK